MRRYRSPGLLQLVTAAAAGLFLAAVLVGHATLTDKLVLAGVIVLLAGGAITLMRTL